MIINEFSKQSTGTSFALVSLATILAYVRSCQPINFLAVFQFSHFVIIAVYFFVDLFKIEQGCCRKLTKPMIESILEPEKL